MNNKEEKYVDLHVHTTYSDGNFTPKQVVEYCKKVNIAAVGITDHDTTDGIEEAIQTAQKEGIEVIPGIELSAEFKESAEGEIHILGYYIDWTDTAFQQKLKIFRQARQERAYKILKNLNKLGIELQEEEIFNNSMSNRSIGRLHFAKLLLEKKIVKSIKEAFDLYLGYGKPAYVPKLRLQPQEAISMILKVKGIPILAHPYFGIYIDSRSIKKLINQGIAGIEVYHSKHCGSVIEELINIADKYDLLITGGSDCHGPLDSAAPLLGTMKLPYSIVESLKKYKQEVEQYRGKILS